jgi:hypothetical protein
MLGESLKGENVVNQKVLVYVSDEAFSSALQPVNCPLEYSNGHSNTSGCSASSYVSEEDSLGTSLPLCEGTHLSTPGLDKERRRRKSTPERHRSTLRRPVCNNATTPTYSSYTLKRSSTYKRSSPCSRHDSSKKIKDYYRDHQPSFNSEQENFQPILNNILPNQELPATPAPTYRFEFPTTTASASSSKGDCHLLSNSKDNLHSSTSTRRRKSTVKASCQTDTSFRMLDNQESLKDQQIKALDGRIKLISQENEVLFFLSFLLYTSLKFLMNTHSF